MIRKSLAILCLLLFSAVPLLAADAVIGPSISVEQKEFEFKPVVEGQQVEHVYTVTNKGSEELRILKVQPG